MGICDQRVVIVTGAGGGLGAAHARVLASEGASVLVNDINTDAAQAVVDDMTECLRRFQRQIGIRSLPST
jgi:NAD(P)-dependent dehydrogenase (short-subunit alcohol dehydrogenase family)